MRKRDKPVIYLFTSLVTDSSRVVDPRVREIPTSRSGGVVRPVDLVDSTTVFPSPKILPIFSPDFPYKQYGDLLDIAAVLDIKGDWEEIYKGCPFLRGPRTFTTRGLNSSFTLRVVVHP